MKKFTKILSGLLAVCNVLSMAVVFLATAILTPTFSPPFYRYEYEKNDVSRTISVTPDDLMLVTEHMLDYMKDKHDALDIEVPVGGVTQPFFNEREREHMVDVKALILFAFWLRRAACAVWIGSVLLLAVCRIKLHTLMRAWRIGLSALTGLLALLILIIAIDFDRAFTLFHELFFNNELWILNPNTDLLINIVPLPFFVDISIVIALIFLLEIAAVVVVSSIILSQMNGKTKSLEKTKR